MENFKNTVEKTLHHKLLLGPKLQHLVRSNHSRLTQSTYESTLQSSETTKTRALPSRVQNLVQLVSSNPAGITKRDVVDAVETEHIAC
jgi:hypothetical protein